MRRASPSLRWPTHRLRSSRKSRLPATPAARPQRKRSRARRSSPRRPSLRRRFHSDRLARRSRAALEERASFTHDYATSLLACRSCNLVYRSPRPAADSVLHAYEGERYAAERLPQMIESQRALFRPKARALAGVLGPGARVLEVGSFVGGFLREARESGLEAVGIDPNEQMAELSRRAGLWVVPETLEEFAARGICRRSMRSRSGTPSTSCLDRAQPSRPRCACSGRQGYCCCAFRMAPAFGDSARPSHVRFARWPGTTCSVFRICTATACGPSTHSRVTSG